MTSERHLGAINLYAALMGEVKVRFKAFDHALNGGAPWPGPITQEFCYLQLRMICELIAMGCLVAHGDITEANKLQKEYAADKIMNALEGLHQDFYPKPHKEMRTGPNSFHLQPLESGFMTKPELISLYRRCGEMLHRGTLRKLLSAKTPIQVDFPEIGQTLDKIHALLNGHRLALIDGRTHFLCTMVAGPEKLVQVVIAEPSPDKASGIVTDVTDIAGQDAASSPSPDDCA